MRNARSLLPVLVVTTLVVGGCSRQAVVQSEPGNPRATANLDGTLRDDLSRLASAESDFRAAHGSYTDQLGLLGFSPSAGVQVSVLDADRDGFSAIAASGDSECGYYTGDTRSPRSYVTSSSTPVCRP